MLQTLSVCLAVCVVLAPTAVVATTIRVPDQEPTIQAGINAATPGDTVLVACGTYYEHDIIISEPDVWVRGDTGDPDCVTIDAQGLGWVFRYGISYSGGIEGFTIMGGHANNGGGIQCYESEVTLMNLRITDNVADSFGGGVYCFDCSPDIIGCVFDGNTANEGGGLHCHDWSSPSITNATFYGNDASSGSAVHVYWQSHPTFENSIMAFNTGDEAVACGELADAMLTCCDVFGNPGGDWVGCIAGQNGVNGNFSADPLFCDPAVGDLTIANVSPCAPPNNDCGVLIGALGVGCTWSPAELRSWGSIKTTFR